MAMHIGVLSTAFLVAVLVPGLLAVVCRQHQGGRRGSPASADDFALRVLDEWMGAPSWSPLDFGPAPLEEVAADLRRLGRERTDGLCRQSVRWQAAVEQAYDVQLSMASRALGVPHQLSALAGMDLALERLRVEEELQAAGMKLR